MISQNLSFSPLLILIPSHRNNMTSPLTSIVFNELDTERRQQASVNDASTHSIIFDSAHVRDEPEQNPKDQDLSGKKTENRSSIGKWNGSVLRGNPNERKAFRLVKAIKRAKQKSRLLKACVTGQDDESCCPLLDTPLLNPHAIRGERSLDLKDDNSLQENITCDQSMRTERSANGSRSSRSRWLSTSPQAPFQVLSPSFATHERTAKERDGKSAKRLSSASRSRSNKPPLSRPST